MSASDTAALMTSSALSSRDLFYVHIDERQRSITLGFTAQEGHEGFEFFIEFTDVRDVVVRGWAAPGHKDVQLTQTVEGITVSVEAEGSSLSFRAASMSVARSRSFHAAP
ncbi:hypothetical protein ABZ027_39705 [Streptomyces sp. NPDC006332]|uniref:hypothetical protein n=1 Tax=Streptomyces sp. NPDC006332 TaxID=3155456 RepID=UPI0033B690B9